MNNELIESIFGCLEHIEEKLDKQPVQTEQGKSEEDWKPMEVLETLAASQEQGHKRLEALWAVLKIISDRQKESRKELLDTLGSKLEALSAKGDEVTAEEIQALRQCIAEQISKPQHKKAVRTSFQVTHDLTTKTWYLVGVGTVLFFCMFLLTTKIYDQSKEIEELQLAGWKYRALRATLPANNANVIWLERNVWAGNKDGIRHCQQFVINYEDSIRHRHQMEMAAQQREQEGQRLMRESDSIKKQLRR